MFNRRKPINVDGRQLAWQFEGEPGASFDVSDAAAPRGGGAGGALSPPHPLGIYIVNFENF